MPETKKPSVLICLLCSFERHGWINPGLLETLLMSTFDQRFRIQYRTLGQYHQIDVARNFAVKMARELDIDWLLMIDNDQDCRQLLDILAEAHAQRGVDIVSVATGTIQAGGTFTANVNVIQPVQMNGKFARVDFAGTGVFMIRSNVLRTMPAGRLFQWNADATEAEDQFFCRIAQTCGFSIWTHSSFASHYHTVDLTPLVPGIGTPRK